MQKSKINSKTYSGLQPPANQAEWVSEASRTQLHIYLFCKCPIPLTEEAMPAAQNVPQQLSREYNFSNTINISLEQLSKPRITKETRYKHL